jgi:hypothetical protein
MKVEDCPARCGPRAGAREDSRRGVAHATAAQQSMVARRCDAQRTGGVRRSGEVWCGSVWPKAMRTGDLG